MSQLLSLFAILSAFVSAPAFAAPQETITDNAAYLTFSYCPVDPVSGQKPSDCSDSYHIVVKGKSYLPVGNTESITKEIQSVVGAHQFHKMKTSGKFSVTGYSQTKTNSGGWGPRTYTVFVITQSSLRSVPLPKSLPPIK